MVQIRSVLALLLLIGAGGQAAAADFPKLSVRESVTVWWNTGWGDKFYFHTLNMDEYLREGSIDLNRTLRHTTGLNTEVWWTPVNVSRGWPISFVGKYRYLSFSIEDSISFSFEHSVKALEADLNFLSAGIRLSHTLPLLNVYSGLDAGYCFGSLVTDQLLESPGDFTYQVRVHGNGGGFFNEVVIGASTLPVLSGPELRLFLEAGLRTAPEWNAFGADNVVVETETGTVPPNIKVWLKNEDRDISRLEGWFISFGVQLGIL